MQKPMQQFLLNAKWLVRESHGDALKLLRGRAVRVGESFSAVIRDLTGAGIEAMAEAVMSGGKSLTRELTCVRPGQETAWLLLTLSPYVRNKRVVGMAAIVENITLEKSQTAQNDLVKIQHMAEWSRRILELTNPLLNSLLNRLSALSLSTTARSELDQAQALLYKLMQIMHGLEGFRVERRLQNQTVDIRRTMEKSIDMAAMLFTQSRIRFEIQSDITPMRVRGNEVTFEQCFIHLLRNAAEAMPKGGLITVTLRRDLGNQSVHIEVTDQGIGMSSGEAAQACEPFFTTKKGDHLGLGLAVSLLVVKTCNGLLNIKSVPRQGTTISIMLPLDRGYSLHKG